MEQIPKQGTSTFVGGRIPVEPPQPSPSWAREYVKPALTAEEWANEAEESLADRIGYACSEAGRDDVVSRHALAALSLHDQPFGFSWMDVDDERAELAEMEERFRREQMRAMQQDMDSEATLASRALGGPDKLGARIARKRSRVARIEALLRPRG